MKFDDAYFSARHLWASPFVRWQGSLADVSSLDLAVAVTRDALARVRFDPADVSQIVLGTTIPQPHSFFGAPWVAARLGMTGISGPHIAQACATSVACVHSPSSRGVAESEVLANWNARNVAAVASRWMRR